MTITNEKIEALAKYMGENEERAEMLMALSAEEACVKINADGYDFTTEELAEFAQGISNALGAKEELAEDSLEAVTGGAADPWSLAITIVLNQAPHAWRKGQEWGRAIGNWLFKR